MKRTILTHPDGLGRVMYLGEWFDPDKPYCGVCGEDPKLNCPHVGTREYGRCAQVFFGILKQKEKP